MTNKQLWTHNCVRLEGELSYINELVWNDRVAKTPEGDLPDVVCGNRSQDAKSLANLVADDMWDRAEAWAKTPEGQRWMQQSWWLEPSDCIGVTLTPKAAEWVCPCCLGSNDGAASVCQGCGSERVSR